MAYWAYRVNFPVVEVLQVTHCLLICCSVASGKVLSSMIKLTYWIDSDGILCSYCKSLMWSFFEFSGFFCSIAVCLFTPLKENSVEWWGTKEASPSLSKQSSLILFDVVVASQSLPFSSVGAEQNRSINRQRFLCHRYFPAKGGK